jgi:hypothetical protein
MPSLQVPPLAQAGHEAHVGPKRPAAQALQDAPTNPASQVQLPIWSGVPWLLQVFARVNWQFAPELPAGQFEQVPKPFTPSLQTPPLQLHGWHVEP